ncbi:MAG: DNA-binding response regulator, partial [Synechococcaceae bacterium WB6_3B_236]|nr:DNA-binding response regulator [Synechococcaceae bacterium WB6_3B_236]
MELLSLRDAAEPRRREVAQWFLSSGIRPKFCLAFGSRLALIGAMGQFKRPKLLVSASTTEAVALAAVVQHQAGVLVCSDQLESGDGFSLIKRSRELVPDLRTFIFLASPDSDLQRALSLKPGGICHEQDLGTDDFPVRRGFLSLATDRFYLGPTAKQILASRGETKIPLRMEDLLTKREQSVLDQVISGKGDRQISEELGLSYETVRSYVKEIRRKLGVKTK